MITRKLRWLGAPAALLLAFTLLGASPASAQTIDVDYDVTGTTTMASTGSTIELGPAVMESRTEADGSFTGDMELPGTRTEFKALGLLPVSADVSFTATGPTTGELIRVGRDRVLESTSSYYVQLRNIKVAGLIPMFVGEHCRTKDPVEIPANTPDGEFFDIADGGTLTGEYSIGKFQHCGLATGLINLLVPGDGNTVELNLSNGRLH